MISVVAMALVFVDARLTCREARQYYSIPAGAFFDVAYGIGEVSNTQIAWDWGRMANDRWVPAIRGYYTALEAYQIAIGPNSARASRMQPCRYVYQITPPISKRPVSRRVLHTAHLCDCWVIRDHWTGEIDARSALCTWRDDGSVGYLESCKK